MARGIETYDPAPLLALQGDRTIAQFAEVLGVTRFTVSRWRSGVHRPTRNTVDRASIALDLHPANLWPEWGQRGLA